MVFLVKKWLKRIGLVLALPLLLIVGGLIYAGLKIAFYSQKDDATHLAAKAAYLKELTATAASRLSEARPSAARPNVLILFYDDLGYGDLGFTGSKAIKTPNIDALAAAGTVISNFHSASPLCSPSRAALLTGRMPPRAGMTDVVFPTGKVTQAVLNKLNGVNIRIPAEEITIADVLKADGYRTAMVGKWHMGDRAPSLPNNMGFDQFYGAHYSNDMEPFALWRNDQVEVPASANQEVLNANYTREVVRTIETKSDKPFFLWLAHNFPHEPLHAPASDRGKSAAGLYGDVVEGLDRGVGEIVAALKKTGQFENTIIILTSDNGPWYEGSPGPNRGRKGQTFGGGTHVPFFIHWPRGLTGGRTIPAMAASNDIFPTLLDWLGLPAPNDRIIDGQSIRPLLEGKAVAPRFTYHYAGKRLMTVSDGRFTYHDQHPYIYPISGMNFMVATQRGPWLFDLSTDADESYNVSMRYQKDAGRLKAALDARVGEDKANPRGWK